MRRQLTTIAVACAVAITLAACGNDDTTGGDTTTASTTSVVVPNGSVDPERVLLAAILLEVGDIDEAIAAGLVNPDEVDLAVSAIDGGSLSEWVERAESP